MPDAHASSKSWPHAAPGRELLAGAQAAALLLFAGLLISPVDVPDPFALGSQLAWPFVCLVASALIWIPDLVTGRWPSTALDWPLAAYLAIVGLTAISGVNRWNTLLAVLALAGHLSLYYATVTVARKVPPVTPAVLLILVVGIALLQLVAFAYHAGLGLGVRPSGYPIPAGWSGYPELSVLGVVQIGFLMAGLQTARRATGLFAALALILVAAAELIFLYARTAWLAVATMMLLALLVATRKSLARIALVCAVLVTLAAGLMVVSAPFRYLAQGLVGRAGTPPAGWKPWEVGGPDTRVEIWKRTFHLIAAFPIRGVGLGNFRQVFESPFNPEIGDAGRYRSHAHNLWLHQAAEVGVIGGLCYLALWGCAVWHAWVAARRRLSFATAGLLLAIAGVAATSMLNNMYFSTGDAPGRLYSLTWLLFGLSAAHAGEPGVR